MYRCCPRPCGDLTSAAVFISAGVVQIIAGIILLRSKYVFLLSGPDFWTAAANISVGALVGVAASVWKRPESKKTTVFLARYRLMLALFLSSVIVNVTTTTILILGGGNAHLSIYLEQDSVGDNATFATEILAYAYAASVIVPIVCATVSTLSVLSRCCEMINQKSPAIKCVGKRKKKVRTEGNAAKYSWVFAPNTSNVTKSSNPACDHNTEKEALPLTLSRPSNELTSVNLPKIKLLPSRRSDFIAVEQDISKTSDVVPVKVTPPRRYEPGIPIRTSSLSNLSGSWRQKRYAKSNYGTYTVVPKTNIRTSSFIANDNRSRPKLTSFRSGRQMKENCSLEFPVVYGSPYPKKVIPQRRLLSAMESISEASQEDSGYLHESEQTTGYESMLNSSPFTPTDRYAAGNSSVFSNDENTTIPKKLWTSVEASNKNGFRSKSYDVTTVFDADSFVGLSNLELLARSKRNRNLLQLLKKRILGV